MKVKKNANHKMSAAERAERNIDRDIKSCMKCHYFWGNDHRCVNSKCYKEKKIAVKPEPQNVSECTDCPYKQSDTYCFPCMKKIMEKKANEEILESEI
ncbi:MAG: hypothetical protein RR717_07590 [Lachnospiraceae bacterium]